MASLPIAYREMLVTAKSPVIYRGRIITTVILLIAGSGLAAIYHNVGVRAVAPFMQSIGFFFLIYCLSSGAQATCDSISREKREGTLGLLFLTHMGSGQILFGKLIAASLLVFYGLFTTFPLLSILFLIGGVEWNGVLRLCLAAVNTMFFSTSLGLFCSSVSVQRRRASAAATWLVLFFWFVPGGIVQYFESQRYTAPFFLTTLLYAISPSHGFVTMSPMPASVGKFSYWISLAGVHTMGWIFLSLAWYFLPRKWQDKPASGNKRSLRERWRQLTYGNPERRRNWRTRLLAINPFYWLASRDRLKPVFSWSLLLAFLVFFIFAYWQSGFENELTVLFVAVLTVMQKAFFSGASTARLTDDHEQGTLELLLSTPLKVREIVRGMALSLWWQFRGPIVLLLALQLCLAAAIYYLDLFSASEGERLGGAVVVLLISALHLLDLFTMSRLGLWSVVTARKIKQAGGTTIGLCFFVPAVIFGLMMMVGGLATWYFDLPFVPKPWQIFTLWYGISVVNDLLWLWIIRRSLPARLRDFATKRYVAEEEPTFLTRVFSRRKASA